MLIYYIDDSFFSNTDFSRSMRYKLEVLIRENNVSHVLISTSKDKEKQIDRFKERIKDFDVEFVLSTQAIDLNGNRLVLTNSMLRLPSEDVRCFSGTVCVIDGETLKWERIYLDLFPEEETDIVSLLTEALEEQLGLSETEKLIS